MGGCFIARTPQGLVKRDFPRLSLNLTPSEEWETSRYQAKSLDDGQTGAGWRLLVFGGNADKDHQQHSRGAQRLSIRHSVRVPFFACHGLAGRPATDSEQVSVQPDPHGSGAYKYFLNALLRSGNSKRAEFFAERMVYNTQESAKNLITAGQSFVDLVDQFVR